MSSSPAAAIVNSTTYRNAAAASGKEVLESGPAQPPLSFSIVKPDLERPANYRLLLSNKQGPRPVVRSGVQPTTKASHLHDAGSPVNAG
jgi:hypothetical protein